MECSRSPCVLGVGGTRSHFQSSRVLVLCSGSYCRRQQFFGASGQMKQILLRCWIPLVSVDSSEIRFVPQIPLVTHKLIFPLKKYYLSESVSLAGSGLHKKTRTHSYFRSHWTCIRIIGYKNEHAHMNSDK